MRLGLGEATSGCWWVWRKQVGPAGGWQPRPACGGDGESKGLLWGALHRWNGQDGPWMHEGGRNKVVLE